jgi:hypothetical protein
MPGSVWEALEAFFYLITINPSDGLASLFLIIPA